MTTQTNALQQIQFELKAPKSKNNDFGHYKYRNCEDILEAVKPLLNKHGATLIITDDVQQIGSVVVVTAKAIFTDADGKETTVTAHAGVDINKKGMDVAQTFGASSSYARKYALNGLFLIDDTKDYDSNEYHNQINNGVKQAQNQNTASSAQSTKTQKPKRTQAQLYNDALAAIKDATETHILDAAMKKFRGTTYEAGITNACRARADMMGWQSNPQVNNSTQQNNQMHS
ncbi:ERF family protein [Acinetobacter stercoris]|uniref:ERF superfamily protein n=1 Tax=Acinetobacter stercoris TaxID=2126983 RepID=A0A2U3N269_9GAMM|nr:ERF family protein [Acinetobacter stercoris]SPL71761.1 ERF superfamily protein [Acinetobacter stercoris]